MSASRTCLCGAQIAPALLVCPACGRLTHAAELSALAADAERAGAAGRAHDALAAWRRALELLPPDAPQAEAIRARIEPLSKRVDAAPLRFGALPKWLAPLGAFGLLLWKFKFVLGFVLTKGKLLLLGLTKGSTFFSMLLAMGVYYTLWGWKFAVGFVLMIYVHEMGHVAALRRLGIRASAPMFVPGLGAFIRMKQYPASVREDARVGLAGPIWGLAAALACYGVYAATGEALFAGLAHSGAVINLFNLIPVWQLDGGRGIRALARRERWLLAAAIGAAFLWAGEGMLLLVALAVVWRAFEKSAPAESDQRAFYEFVGLVAALALLAAIEVPGIARS